MLFGDKIFDSAHNDVSHLLEHLVELINLPSLVQCHHRDFIFGKAFDDFLVVFKYFEGISENIVVIAAGTF